MPYECKVNEVNFVPEFNNNPKKSEDKTMRNVIISAAATIAVAISALTLGNVTNEGTTCHLTQAEKTEIYIQVLDGCLTNNE